MRLPLSRLRTSEVADSSGPESETPGKPEKPEKAAKTEKSKKPPKPDKAEKPAKTPKAEKVKTEKPAKAQKTKPEKAKLEKPTIPEKAEKPEQAEKANDAKASNKKLQKRRPASMVKVMSFDSSLQEAIPRIPPDMRQRLEERAAEQIGTTGVTGIQFVENQQAKTTLAVDAANIDLAINPLASAHYYNPERPQSMLPAAAPGVPSGPSSERAPLRPAPIQRRISLTRSQPKPQGEGHGEGDAERAAASACLSLGRGSRRTALPARIRVHWKPSRNRSARPRRTWQGHGSAAAQRQQPCSGTRPGPTAADDIPPLERSARRAVRARDARQSGPRSSRGDTGPRASTATGAGPWRPSARSTRRWRRTPSTSPSTSGAGSSCRRRAGTRTRDGRCGDCIGGTIDAGGARGADQDQGGGVRGGRGGADNYTNDGIRDGTQSNDAGAARNTSQPADHRHRRPFPRSPRTRATASGPFPAPEQDPPPADAPRGIVPTVGAAPLRVHNRRARRVRGARRLGRRARAVEQPSRARRRRGDLRRPDRPDGEGAEAGGEEEGQEAQAVAVVVAARAPGPARVAQPAGAAGRGAELGHRRGIR